MDQNEISAPLTKMFELTFEELELLGEVLTACISEENEDIRMLEESEWLMLEALIARVQAAKSG